MASRDELYAALRNADAAGDTAAATRLAQYIRTLPEAQPVRPLTPSSIDPTEGMSFKDKALSGAGKSFVDTAHGLMQLGADVGEKMGLVSPETVQAMQEEETRRAMLDNPLMHTGGGIFGNVVGSGLQMIAGGAAVSRLPGAGALVNRLSAMGKAGKVIGAGGTGALFGATQPVTDNSSRLGNAAVSGVGGMVGAVAVPAAVAGVNKLADMAAPGVASTIRQGARAAGGAASSAWDRVTGQSVQPVVQRIEPALVISRADAERTAEALVISRADAERTAEAAAAELGFNWATLDDAIKQKMQNDVFFALNTKSGISPEGVAKGAVLESMGFKPTRAMLTGRPQDYATENSLRLHPEGDPLHEIDMANNMNLRQQIQQTAGRNVPVRDSEFGSLLRNQLSGEAAVAENRTGNLYRDAAQQEGHITTNAEKLISTLHDKQAFAVSKQDSLVREYLRRIGKDETFFPSQNTAAAENQPKELTMSELSTLRQIINSRWENADNATQASLNKIRGVLNDMEANPNQPAPLYQKARVSRIIQGNKWESPELSDLFAQDPTYKGRMIVADEDVFKHAFITPTTDKTASIWQRMNLEQKNATRAQVAKYIEDQTFSNMGMTHGIQRDPIGSAAKMIRVIDGQIGYDKMRLILGEQEASRLQNLARAWQDIQSSPPGTKSNGSAPEIARMSRAVMSILGSLKSSGLPIISSISGKLQNVVGESAKESAAKLARTQQVGEAITPIQRNKLIEITRPKKTPSNALIRLGGAVGSDAALINSK